MSKHPVDCTLPSSRYGGISKCPTRTRPIYKVQHIRCLRNERRFSKREKYVRALPDLPTQCSMYVFALSEGLDPWRSFPWPGLPTNKDCQTRFGVVYYVSGNSQWGDPPAEVGLMMSIRVPKLNWPTYQIDARDLDNHSDSTD